MVTMMKQAGYKRNMAFTSCDVKKALGSVSAICKQEHRVVFNPPNDPEGSYIQHLEGGERMYLKESDGLYLLDTKVAPRHKQARPFGGQGA